MNTIKSTDYTIKITQKSVLDILVKRCGWTEEADFGVYTYYRSPCKRYTLQESDCSNLFDPHTGKGWNMHIDNSDMMSLASCNVEYIGQITELMKIYSNY